MSGDGYASALTLRCAGAGLRQVAATCKGAQRRSGVANWHGYPRFLWLASCSAPLGNLAPSFCVSIQEHFTDTEAGTQAVRRALEVLSRSVDLLPAGSEAAFRAANDNLRWALRLPKRLLDIAIAVPALIFVLPLLAILAVLIRLDSSGPVLFRQKRLGYRGQPFDILKLRTMRVLENGETVVQASAGDARTTRVGRWLRTFSLDELPQLINVVKGEMSLVGPRPHAWAHDMLYARLIPGYERRQCIKPGITGWAQVHGLRGPTPTVEIMSRRVEHDAWYADNASLALDLKILLRTPLELVRRRNAC